MNAPLRLLDTLRPSAHPYWLLGLVLLSAASLPARLDAADSEHLNSEEVAFFESRIRPLLLKHCYECHSAESNEIKGGLVLDVAAGLLQGGDSGPAIVAGEPDESLLVEAVRYESFEMPPAGKLPEAAIRDLEQWVEMGAPDPRTEPAVVQKKSINLEQGRQFWAFQPAADVLPPHVDCSAWPRSDIDRFVLAPIEKLGLEPPADAAWLTVARRVHFDLTGLPPTPAFVAQAQASEGGDALERLVDELLASREFGVHWGRRWLDVARYADSNGADFNATFHNAWRYRDYVVDAFNNDKPFNRFIREQLAGDLLPYDSDQQRAEQLIATGFLMIGTKMLSERDKEKMTLDVVDEQIDTVGRAFMGLTLGCARCHDHKFDPIPAEDYYALAGIFSSTRTLEGESQKYVSTWPRTELPAAPEHIAAVQAYEQEKKALAASLKRLKKVRGQATSADAKSIDKQMEALRQQEAELEKDAPRPLPRAIAVAELADVHDEYVRIRGEHHNRGPQIPRGFLQVVNYGGQPTIAPQTSGRQELADWIASPDHPLTARVIVNRVWYHLIGEGIVPSIDNFGALGERPTHPELLDYLARRFVSPAPEGLGWSIKKLVREIVLSRTYGVSSSFRADAERIDPGNELLTRAHRRRLPAEAIRDAMLFVSGRLDKTPGGSPVEGLGVLVTQNKAGAKEFKRQASLRRSMYLPIIRNELPPLLTTFDFADPDLVVGRRSTTNVPTQSLLLMNSPFVMDCSDSTAKQLLYSEAAVADPAIAVRQAYRSVLSRPPTEREIQQAVQFLQAGVGEQHPSREALLPELARFVQVLFASAEFRMLD